MAPVHGLAEGLTIPGWLRQATDGKASAGDAVGSSFVTEP
jgi:hypothetical protein